MSYMSFVCEYCITSCSWCHIGLAFCFRIYTIEFLHNSLPSAPSSTVFYTNNVILLIKTIESWIFYLLEANDCKIIPGFYTDHSVCIVTINLCQSQIKCNPDWYAKIQYYIKYMYEYICIQMIKKVLKKWHCMRSYK